MKEIGGYIELEHYNLPMLHEGAVTLNCAKNALAYIIETKKIKHILMPFFMCRSSDSVFIQYNVKVEKYHIDEHFMPICEKINENEWIYIVNFYGQLDNTILYELKKKYTNVIVDNTQSYFQMPIANVDTLYSCRKYFGVADGAFLYTNKKIDRQLEQDESYSRMTFLLGRFECTASEFYDKYVENNALIEIQPIKTMSKLTENLLRGINYNCVGSKRQHNFEKLYKAFSDINELDLIVPYGAFMYPLLIKNVCEVRKKLQLNKIYVPTLWPNVLEECKEGTLEYEFAKNILPLPIDQRYEISDMEYMEDMVRKCID